jgi:predicted kinase
VQREWYWPGTAASRGCLRCRGDFRLMKKPTPLAVMMIGNPASGKSTIARSLSEGLGLERVSADDLVPRDEHGKRMYRRHILRRCWVDAWKQIGRCVRESRSFVLGAMLLTNERRNPAIGVAIGARFATVGVHMNTSVDICMIRNSLRMDRVTDGRLLSATSRLDPPDPCEGWTAVYRVDQNRWITRWYGDSRKEEQVDDILAHFDMALRKAVEHVGIRCEG